MPSLQDKYYGLSILSWLIILVLVVIFYFTIFPNDTSNEETPTTKPSANQQNVKEKFSETSGKIKVYNFNTEWCGYSIRFQPEWDKFEAEVKAKGNLSNVQAYDVKCDNPKNEQMCMDYEVPGFPTVIIEKGKEKKVYQGPRTAQSLIETVEKMQ